MIPGFHTSALSEHDLATASEVLVGIGYRAVAVRLSRARLDPLAAQEVRAMQLASLRSGLRVAQLVIDADGHYLTDPWSSEPAAMLGRGTEVERRLEYLRAAVEAAGECGGGHVTFSTGPIPRGMEVQEALDQLMERAGVLSEAAERARVHLCVRPRPGHFVDSLGRFERLKQWTVGQAGLSLAADVAAMVALGEMPVVDLLRRIGPPLRCVYLADVRLGDAGAECWVGGGHVSAGRVAAGLLEVGFAGPVLVEPGESQNIGPQDAAALYRRIFGA